MSNGKLTKSDTSIWARIARTIRPLGVKGPMPTAPIISAADIKPSIRPWHPVLDLHGMTLHDAHRAFREHVKTARRLQWKKITVITGRSGDIFREFTHWLADQPVRSYQLQSNGGSYTIWLEHGPSTQTRS
jgi:hypothetical protein